MYVDEFRRLHFLDILYIFFPYLYCFLIFFFLSCQYHVFTRYRKRQWWRNISLLIKKIYIQSHHHSKSLQLPHSSTNHCPRNHWHPQFPHNFVFFFSLLFLVQQPPGTCCQKRVLLHLCVYGKHIANREKQYDTFFLLFFFRLSCFIIRLFLTYNCNVWSIHYLYTIVITHVFSCFFPYRSIYMKNRIKG